MPFFQISFAIFLVIANSQLQLCSTGSNTNCLPCPSQCNSCSNSSACLSCSVQYYLSSSTAGTCSSCPQNCLQCSSGTVCTQCANPYVLTNSSCSLCTIINALSCSSTVAASSCKSGYYLSGGYCNSCLLNCIGCTSAYDCTSCASGYYLNTSILTCNPCSQGCSSCNQYTPSVCTSCNDGYQLINQNCVATVCNIANCLYCSQDSICKRCQVYYYWNGSACLSGASISCVYGATGPLPNNCINKCSDYEYVSGNVSNVFGCKFYQSAYVSSIEHTQKYYYAFNHKQKLDSLTGAAQTLSVESNGEYSYPLSGALNFTSLPNYYKIIIGIKYSAAASIKLTLTAAVPTDTQTQSFNLPSAASPVSTTLTTAIVHSYNLKMTPNASLSLIQLSLKFYKCSAGCTVCLNQQLCQLCDSPNFMLAYGCVANCSSYVHFLPNMTCLTSCPSYYYQIESGGSKFCTGCIAPCLDCTNSTFCLSCTSNYFYYNYACGTSCPSGYYADNSTRTCKSCISPCRTCSSQGSCLSCALGFWNGSKCATSCPSGYYGDNGLNSCVVCSVSCLTCINSATTCTSCNSSLIYYNSQCLQSCPVRFYNLNGSCAECLPPCYTCSNSTYCLSCSFNYLKDGACISSCPDGYYQDQAALSCVACQAQCKTCASSYSCITCKSGCLYSGQCPSSCPSTSFFGQIDNATSTCSCQQCIYPCSTCSNSSVCLTCVDGYLYAGSCLVQCPTSYYGSSITGACTLCSLTYAQCLTCTSKACTLCNSGYYILNGVCLTSCPTYYYPSLQQCVICSAPCLTCSDPSTCLSCVSPYALLGSTCVMECSTGQLSQVINNITQCVSCTAPCLSCSLKPNNCTYCLYGFYLYNYQCLTNCSSISPVNTYYSQSSTLACQLCSFPCLTCLSESQCLSCKVGYLNPSAYTCTQCNVGTYAVNMTCIACPAACSICYSDTYCSGCNSGYYLFINSCVGNASICEINGYYVSGNICYACLQPCATCSKTASNCSSCLSGYIFHPPNQCLIECPTGYYRNSNQCLACSAQCSSCVTSSVYCLSCSSGYYLFISNASCVSQCPSGTFLSGSACSLCQYPCSTCTSELQCLSCITGVLIGTQCYTSCLSGYYADNKLCYPCTSPCRQCNLVATNCTQCVSGYYLLDNTCITNCPSNWFPESQSQQCLQCVGLCNECSSYINCTSCSSSFIFYYSATNNVGECISSCPTGYYLANNTCNVCKNQCLTCGDGNSCLLCSSSLVQLNGQCMSSCPTQMYSLSGVCNNCSFPCQNCTDAYTCTSCPNTYLLVGGSSCMPGPDCPSGYYLLVDAPQCDKKCPGTFYNLKNGTCNSVSCGDQYFMGADMFCYSECPSGFIANASYHCVACTKCSGLYFSLDYKIIKNELFLYLTFTQTPYYAISPVLSLSPAWPIKAINFPGGLVAGSSFTGQTNITFLVNTEKSLTSAYLTVSFTNQLLTFANPLQKADCTIYVDGFDFYPPDLPNWGGLGMLTLMVALIGLGKNPYMIDFAQTLFLIGLVDCHFPTHLASFLESAGIANLHGFLSIEQSDSLGDGKFMYLTGTGFLTNTLTNWVVIVIVLFISLILFLLLLIMKKRLNYSKVHDEAEQPNANQQGKPETCLSALDNNFDRFKYRILNRVVYFNYSLISLFALVQLANFNTSTTINLLASVLALLTLIPLIYFPLSFRNDKPKYTFLYIRKLLISGAVVLSLKDAIYAIGIISVCNLTAAVLIMTYKLEKYRYESRFLAGCQLAQLLVQACLSFFIMIGQGNSTSSKVTLCFIIIFAILIILIVYTIEALMQLICFIYFKCRGVELREEWILNQQELQDSSHHSESINGSMKQTKTQKAEPEQEEQKKKEDNLQTLLVQIKQEMKDKLNQELARDFSQFKQQEKQHENRGNFWAYSESEKDEKEVKGEKAPPNLLVRCINEFSDYEEEHNKQ